MTLLPSPQKRLTLFNHQSNLCVRSASILHVSMNHTPPPQCNDHWHPAEVRFALPSAAHSATSHIFRVQTGDSQKVHFDRQQSVKQWWRWKPTDLWGKHKQLWERKATGPGPRRKQRIWTTREAPSPWGPWSRPSTTPGHLSAAARKNTVTTKTHARHGTATWRGSRVRLSKHWHSPSAGTRVQEAAPVSR